MNSIRLEINQTRTLLFAMRDQLTNKVAAYETMKMIGIPINHNSMVIARRDLTSCLTVTRDLGTLFMNQHANGECTDPECTETTETFRSVHESNQEVTSGMLADIAKEEREAGETDYTPVEELLSGRIYGLLDALEEKVETDSGFYL